MWQKQNDELYAEFGFKDFREAFGFMQVVAGVAEDLQHHPRWENTYNKVKIWLSTHDAGGKVTDKDEELASKIDEIYKSYNKTSQKQPSTQRVFRIVKLYADGGSRGNPGPSASGYVLMDEEENIIKKSGEYLGVTTNNQAEYQALKLGLEEAKKLGAREVKVFLDSLLVVNQMKGVFKVRNRDLWPIHEAIKEIAAGFKKVIYTHVPRELNKLADAEVNEVLDAEATP